MPSRPAVSPTAPRVTAWLCALALGLGLALAGCASDEEEEKPGDAKAGQADAPSPRDVVSRVSASTVSVNGDDGDFHSHGSGVIIDAERNLVLTSGHVVDAARAIAVTLNEETTVKARVVARAQCEDLALLALFPRQDGLIELPFGDSSKVASGDKVLVLSYPGLAKTAEGKEKLAVTEGRVSVTDASTQLTDLLPAFPSLIAHQAPVTHQSTGAPLLSENGEWIGMNLVMPEAVAAKGPAGIAYAVPTKRIKELIDELTPGEKSFFAGWEKYHACHRQMEKLARGQQVADHDLPSGAKPRRGGGHGPAH